MIMQYTIGKQCPIYKANEFKEGKLKLLNDFDSKRNGNLGWSLYSKGN